VAPGELPGRLGDFRVVREVGRGGMGVVYEAVQESLGRRVALKVLPFHGSIEPTHRERFRREAAAAARLHHTNIVPVFGVGACGGVEYYAMQFIEGRGLDAVLDALRRLRDGAPALPEVPPGSGHDEAIVAAVARSLTGPHRDRGSATRSDRVGPSGELPARRPGAPPSAADAPPSHWPVATGAGDFRNVAAVGAQIAAALDYAHAQGVLHRDIKPSNLLLDTQGAVWVTDFGLAKSDDSDELTRTGDVVGTLRYMAPERFQGRADRRSEVYGVGLTLYELLTLRPAFQASHRGELIEQVRHREPPAPRTLDRRIPRDLETIVLKAVAKEPARRYATAGELAEDLRRFLDDRPIRARRITAAGRALRWCRRNRALSALLFVATLALVAVALISVVDANRQAAAAREIAGLADRLKGSLAESNRRLAVRNFEHGQAAFEKDQLGPGLLWMVESWRSAVAAGDPAWQRAARANVSTWSVEHPRLRGVFSQDRPVTALAVSPDGRVLVTAGGDYTAQLWDVATRKPVTPPLQHRSWVFGVAFSPDGKTVLTGSRDATARLWDAATGQPVGPLLVHTPRASDVTPAGPGGAPVSPPAP
jgi:serine/threonine protein kinase